MIFGICMVKDEEDVIATVLSHMLAEGVDHLIVADNLSTDATPAILATYAAAWPDKFTILEDSEPGYYQSQKMTYLAEKAHEKGARWVIPFDADEIWYSPRQTIREALNGLNAAVVNALAWDHIARWNDPPGNPMKVMAYRRDHPQRMYKVAFRSTEGAVLHQGNHDVSGVGGERTQGVLEIRHFQYRSFEQMKRKVRQGKAAYDASDLHEMHGTHWRSLGALSDEELRAEWEALTHSEGLVFDPAPLRSSSRSLEPNTS